MLTNCDTHDNFPPGVFKAMPAIAKLPGGMAGRWPRRSGFPPWPAPPSSPSPGPRSPTRADRLLDGAGEAGPRDHARPEEVHRSAWISRYTQEAAAALRGSQLPILLAWAPGDKFFPISYAERLARRSRQHAPGADRGGEDLVALDQPQRLAEEIAQFAPTA